MDSGGTNLNFSTFNSGSVTVTCAQQQQTFSVAPHGQGLCDRADILTLPGAAPAPVRCFAAGALGGP